MVRFIGLDVHRRMVEACILDEAGTKEGGTRFAATPEGIREFASRWVTRADKVALEATTNSWAIVRHLRPLAGDVVVSNPLKTKAIAEARVKTDKVDALVLAQLLRADFLPRVWEPDEATQSLRRLTSRRASVMRSRTAAKNRIHAVLAERLIRPPFEEMFGPDGRAWLREVPLDEEGRLLVDMDLRVIEAVEKELAAFDGILMRRGHGDERVKLLMTLPGVDWAVAQGLLAAWGQIDRFPDADHAAAYLGLVPSTKQSAERCYHGPITKAGNSHARWMLIQAAQHLSTNPGPLGAFFRKLSKKKGNNVATAAAARKLAVIAFHMLTNNEPYRYATPARTEYKLTRLRVRATGEIKRRKTKTAGKPGTKRTKPLAEVYASEGLPPLRDRTDGEERALRAAKVLGFVRGLERGTPAPARKPQKA